MKKFGNKNLFYGLLFGLLVVSMGRSTPVSAAFTEKNLVPLSGDTLLTVDTSTGLEWLDVTATGGMTWDGAELAYPGFRHATKAEVIALVEAFGINWSSSEVWTVANNGPVQMMLSLMGTLPGSANTPYHQSAYDIGNAVNSEISLIQNNISAGTGKATLPQGGPGAIYQKSRSEGGVGHYLIVVPVANQHPDCSGATIADQSAGANCQATISSADVTGVTDPDGDPLTITVSPTTLDLGANTVTVSSDDGNGGACETDITVNVVDDTPPDITCAVEPSGRGQKQVQILYSAEDNCELVSVTAIVDIGCSQIPVSNGQNIRVKHDDDCEFEFEDGVLRIKASTAVLIVTATDAAGNVATCEQSLVSDGDGHGDEDEDNDDHDDNGDHKKDKDKDKDKDKGRDKDSRKGKGQGRGKDKDHGDR